MSTNISSLLQSYLAGLTNPQLRSALMQQLQGNLRAPTLQDIQQAMQRASASLTEQAQAVAPDFPTYTEGNEQDSPAEMTELEAEAHQKRQPPPPPGQRIPWLESFRKK